MVGRIVAEISTLLQEMFLVFVNTPRMYVMGMIIVLTMIGVALAIDHYTNKKDTNQNQQKTI